MATISNRIFVVEDDPDINHLISYNLKKEGFTVESAYEGISASLRLKKEHFDIVILDIMLPGIDGFDICRQVKDSKDGHRTFIIIISARDYSEDKLYAHILGADSYFTKPFEVSRLLSEVKEMTSMLSQELTVKHRQ